MDIHKIYYYERGQGILKNEKVYYERTLQFFYTNFIGRLFCKFISKNIFISRFYGWLQRQPWTRRKIKPFIKKFEVDAREFQKSPEEFPSFDAFFSRKLKKEARPLAEGAIVPADGRYLFYQNIDTCDGFVIKGKKFSLEMLLQSKSLAEKFSGGSMAIVRLCPSDYHRFHFPFDCTAGKPSLLNGFLFAVNPIAVKQNINLFTENKRMLTTLNSPKYGEALFIEIGATCVGSIHQTYKSSQFCKKGDEKGYFSFGGSSIILLFEPGRIQFAEDLLEHSAEQIEILCRFGQPLETPLSIPK